MIIQQVLVEAGSGISHDLVSVDARGVEAAADWATLRSPENYTGYERTENFASPGSVHPDRPRSYTIPAELNLNDWALAGNWTMEQEATRLNTANGQIAYRFQARDLNLVMGGTGPFTVRLDGEPPGEDRGLDVDGSGEGRLTEPRMYQLVRQRAAARRTFEITFHEPGARAYVFTFG